MAMELMERHNSLIGNKTQTRILSETCLKSEFEFEGQIYGQKNGISMGSPLSPIISEIFLSNVEKQLTDQKLKSIGIEKYYRYVDDTLLITNGADIGKILTLFNSLHQKLKFTAEEEKDCSINFLDLKIYKTKNFFRICVFRKPKYTAKLLAWDSHAPVQYKISLLKTLVYRAAKICSDKELLLSELRTLFKIFCTLYYPKSKIRKYCCSVGGREARCLSN